MNKILVTGATGFLGKYVIDELKIRSLVHKGIGIETDLMKMKNLLSLMALLKKERNSRHTATI